jgi:hypothetical protein
MINALTGGNSSPVVAPRLHIAELFYFKSIYASQTEYLKEVAVAELMGDIQLAPGAQRELKNELRNMHRVTKGLEATLDAIYMPVINALPDEEQAQESKVIQLPAPKRRRGRPRKYPKQETKPKRKPGRPKGSKDTHPRKARKVGSLL